MSSSDAATHLGRELAIERDNQRERDSDIAAQLAAIAKMISTEKTLGDDRFETLNKKLDKLLALLTTNGSGGHHE